ncbi:MAG: MarC family protein [bacterium]|nr:MarC family protein [bacterium]
MFDLAYIYSIAMLLFMMMDPFGNLPVFLATLKRVPSRRKTYVIFREQCIAFVAMCISLICGQQLFGMLHVKPDQLAIAGGVILCIVGLKMVFSTLAEDADENSREEPFIVPLAIPLVCGPGLIAILATLRESAPEATWLNCFAALLLAWVVNLVIMLFGRRLAVAMGKRGLKAMENLMGLLLTAIAVGMIINGIKMSFKLAV